jgi:hypothetical protein
MKAWEGDPSYNPAPVLSMAGAANLPAPGPGGPALGTLFLKKKTGGGYPPAGEYGYHKYRIYNEEGKNLHPLDVHYQPRSARFRDQPNMLDVSWIGGDYFNDPNKLGLSNTRSLLMALKGDFPEAQTIAGYRVSGARGRPGGAADTKMRMPSFPPEQMQRYMEARDRILGSLPQEPPLPPLEDIVSRRIRGHVLSNEEYEAVHNMRPEDYEALTYRIRQDMRPADMRPDHEIMRDYRNNVPLPEHESRWLHSMGQYEWDQARRLSAPPSVGEELGARDFDMPTPAEDALFERLRRIPPGGQ